MKSISAPPGPAPVWAGEGGGWLAQARRCPSPNFDTRPPATPIDLVVIHHISLPPGYFRGSDVEALFCNRLDCDQHPAYADLRGVRVSSHFLIRRHGQLVQFVDVADRAWHAGVSRFLDRERCNDFSVGVELEGDGLRPFTNSQYQKLDWLLAALAQHLPIRFIAGHSDIAPGRKFDPGPRFDWARLRRICTACRLKRPYGEA